MPRVPNFSLIRGPLLIAILYTVGTAPVLGWLEFASSMENLNVATALEIKRSGNWLTPTLEGEMRVNKPPLAAWVTAATIPDSLRRRLDSPDAPTRDKAYRELAFRVRLPAVLQTALTALLAGAMAAVLSRSSVAGSVATIAYLSSGFALKLGRSATTDVLLTAWIAVALLGICLAIYRDRRWTGAALAGVGAGLALMSKGPVSLLFIALPLLAMLMIERGAIGRLRRRGNLPPVLLALLLTGAIGLPWFAYVRQLDPNVSSRWMTEITRLGAREDRPGNPLSYLIVPLMALPWLPAAFGAIAGAWRSLRQRRVTPAAWLLLAVVLPLVVMSFAPDRKDRYALPAMVPLACLAGLGLADRRLPPWTIGATLGLVLVVQAAGTGWYSRQQPGRSEMKPLADAIRLARPDAPPILNGRADSKRVPVDLAIYLNRSTVRVKDWPTLPPTDPPRVAVLPQKGATPPAIPPGWRAITSVPRDKDRWWAIEQEPR